MAYQKLLIHVWCDWDPSGSDPDEISSAGDTAGRRDLNTAGNC
jgi:hypothetical protein